MREPDGLPAEQSASSKLIGETWGRYGRRERMWARCVPHWWERGAPVTESQQPSKAETFIMTISFERTLMRDGRALLVLPAPEEHLGRVLVACASLMFATAQHRFTGNRSSHPRMITSHGPTVLVLRRSVQLLHSPV